MPFSGMRPVAIPYFRDGGAQTRGDGKSVSYPVSSSNREKITGGPKFFGLFVKICPEPNSMGQLLQHSGNPLVLEYMQAKKPLIILGSARKDGDTKKLIDLVFKDADFELVELLDHQIAAYDYERNYPEGDQFTEVADLLFQHQVIVFATPVYWYAMSGQMKIFFDRLTDYLDDKEAFKARLKGKKIFVLACSASPRLPDGFELPFSETAEYLGIEYGGAYFSPAYELASPPAGKEEFCNNVNQAVVV